MDKYIGGIAVLENYLEGALNDYEVSSDDIAEYCIEGAINTLEAVSYGERHSHEYRDRYERIKKEKNK